MLLQLLLPLIKFPLLGMILNTIYYGMIWAGIILAGTLVFRKLTRFMGVPARRARMFALLACLVSFPAGVVSSRAANMFYHPASQWSIDFFIDQFLHGDNQTFHASLVLPLLLISGLIIFLRLDFWKTWDTFFLYLPLAHAFGRTGCLLVGCCWGHEITVHVFGTEQVFKNPVPLYAIIVNLGLFVLLRSRFKRLYERNHRELSPAGSIVALYLVGYGIGRFLMELVRVEKTIAFGLTQAQIVMLGFTVFGGLIGLAAWRTHRVSKRTNVGGNAT